MVSNASAVHFNQETSPTQYNIPITAVDGDTKFSISRAISENDGRANGEHFQQRLRSDWSHEGQEDLSRVVHLMPMNLQSLSSSSPCTVDRHEEIDKWRPPTGVPNEKISPLCYSKRGRVMLGWRMASGRRYWMWVWKYLLELSSFLLSPRSASWWRESRWANKAIKWTRKCPSRNSYHEHGVNATIINHDVVRFQITMSQSSTVEEVKGKRNVVGNMYCSTFVNWHWRGCGVVWAWWQYLDSIELWWRVCRVFQCAIGEVGYYEMISSN